MKFECVAKCPELDEDNSPHCAEWVHDDDQYFDLLNKECPCGNEPKWRCELKGGSRMKILKECTLAECPVGLFIWENDNMGFKSEYACDAYCLSSGEFFWGGTNTTDAREKVIVQPVRISDKKLSKMLKGGS